MKVSEYDKSHLGPVMKTWITSVLAGGVIVCGVIGAWAANSTSLSWQASDRIVGRAAILAFALAAIALLRRSWARLPFLTVCVPAGMIIWILSDPGDGIVFFAYVVMNYVIILAGIVALIISITDADRHRQPTTPDQPPNRTVG